MNWFDRQDMRLIAKAGIFVVAGSTAILMAAGVVGLAWRVFQVAAG